MVEGDAGEWAELMGQLEPTQRSQLTSEGHVERCSIITDDTRQTGAPG